MNKKILLFRITLEPSVENKKQVKKKEEKSANPQAEPRTKAL